VEWRALLSPPRRDAPLKRAAFEEMLTLYPD
jgi:hypothetical protein